MLAERLLLGWRHVGGWGVGRGVRVALVGWMAVGGVAVGGIVGVLALEPCSVVIVWRL